MTPSQIFQVFFAATVLSISVGAAPTLRNGSMTEGELSPACWELSRDAEAFRLLRDTQIYASAPAALRLEPTEGKAKGGAIQPLTGVGPGDEFEVRGKVRAEGDVAFAAVAVVTPGAQETWHELTSFAGASGWYSFRRNVKVPEGSTAAMLMVIMDGAGTVWLDDVDLGSAAVDPEPDPLVTDFSMGFAFSYLDWQEKVFASDGVARIQGKTGKGGAGFDAPGDLSTFADWTPAIDVKLGPENKAAGLKLFFNSGTKRMFTYDLSKAGTDGFTQLIPDHARALAAATGGEPDDGFDPAQIESVQLQGDWKKARLDVFVDKVEVVPPTEEMKAMRATLAKRLHAKAEREGKRREEEQRRRLELLAGAPHPGDGPQVVHIGAVDRDILVVRLQAGKAINPGQQGYVPEDGDEIKYKGKDLLVWHRGEIVFQKKGRELHRKGKRLGDYIEAFGTWEPRVWDMDHEGEKLSIVTAEAPEAYRIDSTDDPAFARPLQPTAVYRKSKPNGLDRTAGIFTPMDHRIYLHLPHPLKDGAGYRIEFRGVNTAQTAAEYTHRPRCVRSEAIHVTQIGYRPDDPYKRTCISLWLGTGGAHRYEAIDTFQLLDADTRKTVFTGDARIGFPAGRPEKLKVEKNFVKADVVYLDFHEFSRSGTFVVHVPGIGTSFPFMIGRNTWTEAFKVSMMGFLHHRSGIELGPPFTDYVRPRNMHPGDGFKIFKLHCTHLDGEANEVFADLKEQLGDELTAEKLEAHPDAWGGYMDAGDWDRRVQHLRVSYKQLELIELFPDFFANLALALPTDEAQDPIPDILNEVLWNVSFYRRLQEPGGGVRGGVESTSHPRSGEASWQETELLGVFAPDPVASYRYAATAAKLHRALKPFDPLNAQRYLDTALKAFEWAEVNGDAVLRQVAGRSAKHKLDRLRESSTVERALAAIELYIATEGDRFHGIFRSDNVLTKGLAPDRGSHALFTYARLPGSKADIALQKQAREAIIELADTALEFQSGNAFGITTVVPGFPMMGYLGYYSTPGMILGNPVPEAYILTGDGKYLRGAVAAANFSAGANPLNMTFTVGVGRQYPRQPLHIDSRITGQPAPKGITIYGPMDPDGGFAFNNWVHRWYLREMTPKSRTWPAAEWHVDLPNWPAMSEYTVHQTMAHTAYYWGFLAARSQALSAP